MLSRDNEVVSLTIVIIIQRINDFQNNVGLYFWKCLKCSSSEYQRFGTANFHLFLCLFVEWISREKLNPSPHCPSPTPEVQLTKIYMTVNTPREMSKPTETPSPKGQWEFPASELFYPDWTFCDGHWEIFLLPTFFGQYLRRRAIIKKIMEGQETKYK